MTHLPVLARETIEFLGPVSGGVYVDTNLGLGGHSELILAASAPAGRVIAFEWDPEARHRAEARLAPFAERLTVVPRNFTTLAASLAELGIGEVDGIISDLGLSSYQLDESRRGFSFRGDEPLDMRMDPGQGQTAGELLSRLSEEELADIFFYFGEERQARRIAALIVARRKTRAFKSTAELVNLVEEAVPRRFHPPKIHVATKVFQALRIAVNRELDNLLALLESAPQLLKNDAKFCVLSFHSLEDRLVKRAFASHPALEPLTRRPLVASEAELAVNPRARSAKLRVARKVEGR